MDDRFSTALAAVTSGDLGALRRELQRDRELAAARSATSHPTLLQAVVLEAKDSPDQLEMIDALVEAGAPVDEPLIAAACVDNVVAMTHLLDRDAALDGDDRWSPLEEAIYWGMPGAIALLLERGAKIRNLRTAAALDRIDRMETMLDEAGVPRPEAGPIEWPFHKPIQGPTNEPQSILDNALVYAAMEGQLPAAAWLIDHGARINTTPPGFHYSGTALHWAAIRGHLVSVTYLLERGADPLAVDETLGKTPADWAAHGNQREIESLLREAEV